MHVHAVCPLELDNEMMILDKQTKNSCTILCNDVESLVPRQYDNHDYFIIIWPPHLGFVHGTSGLARNLAFSHKTANLIDSQALKANIHFFPVNPQLSQKSHDGSQHKTEC